MFCHSEVKPSSSVSVSVPCIALGDAGVVTISNVHITDAVKSVTRLVPALCDVVVQGPATPISRTRAVIASSSQTPVLEDPVLVQCSEVEVSS